MKNFGVTYKNKELKIGVFAILKTAGCGLLVGKPLASTKISFSTFSGYSAV
jgi:hypothetical protein